MRRFTLILLLLTVVNVVAQSGQDMIYDYPSEMPKFPGGEDKMNAFIAENLVYPQAAKDIGVKGKVYVQFIVEKNGKITHVVVRKGAHSLLDPEAKKVIEKMPDWEPGKSRGKVVRTRYVIPIVFKT